MDLERLLAEAEIRNLGYRFADAVNRNDAEAMSELWTDDGVWIIDAPMNVRAEGLAAVLDTFRQLMGGWTFFHQIPHQGPIVIDGARATARMYMHEVGIFRDQRTHRNYSEYTDVYLKADGVWRYRERPYHFLYVDGPPMNPDILGAAVES